MYLIRDKKRPPSPFHAKLNQRLIDSMDGVAQIRVLERKHGPLEASDFGKFLFTSENDYIQSYYRRREQDAKSIEKKNLNKIEQIKFDINGVIEQNPKFRRMKYVPGQSQSGEQGSPKSPARSKSVPKFKLVSDLRKAESS
jgi:hypothetical protein